MKRPIYLTFSFITPLFLLLLVWITLAHANPVSAQFGDVTNQISNHSSPSLSGGTVVTTVIPVANSHNTPLNSNLIIAFTGNISATTANDQTIFVHGGKHGRLPGIVTGNNPVTYNPNQNFFPGELVQATVTDNVLDINNNPLTTPYVWQFRTAVTLSAGLLINTGQALGNSWTSGAEIGDLDGDGDLDAFVANELGQPNRVWFNDGSGNFTDSGQSLGNATSLDVALGDIDNDGDLDAFISNYNNQADEVWFNNGLGLFTDSGQTLGAADTNATALGDVDGDGDLDAFTAYFGVGNKVWLNDGTGTFTDSGQTLGTSNSYNVVLGDLDTDGDLDAFVASSGGNEVWLNNGAGTFTDSGQSLGSIWTFGLDLGDLDGDGDLDAVEAGINSPVKVWFNNGAGFFSDSGQSLGFNFSFDVALGDVEGDGDLDAYVSTSAGQENTLYLNNGSGILADSGQTWGGTKSNDSAWGDLDGDGDLDLFIGNSEGWANSVHFNTEITELAISKSVYPATAVPGDTITYTLTYTNLHAFYPANNVVITDIIPSEFILASLSVSSSGTPVFLRPGTTFVWDAPVVPPGANGIITITGVLTAPLPIIPIVNQAEITSDGIDLNPNNNQDSATVTILSGIITANDDSYSTDEDVPLVVAAPGVLANDTNTGGGILTVVASTAPTFGTVNVPPDGSFIYTPTLNTTGVATFTYGVTTGEDYSDLVAYWKLDDGSGLTAADSSGHGHTGTLFNGASWVADTANTTFPNLYALSLDGIDDYVTIPDDDALDFGANDDFTVALWVKIPPNQLDTGLIDNSIVEKWSVNGGYPYVIRYLNQTAGADNGKIQVVRYDGTNVPFMNSATAINDNQYHHVAFIKEGGTLYLYIDGTLSNSIPDTTTFDPSNTSPLFLGVRGNGANRFTGILDDVRIYDRSLSAAEVSDLVQGTSNGTTAVVTITVNPIADPPIAVSDSYTLVKNSSLTVNAPGVLTNDSGPDSGSLTAVLDTPPTHLGSFTLASDGAFVYTPTLDFCGTDSFTYHANDGLADSNIVTATLNITCGTPIAVNDVYTGTEEMPISAGNVYSITTLFAANVGSNGNMFDITTINDITITSFDQNLAIGPHNMEVWYKAGSYVGSETTPGDWTFLGSATVTGLGTDLPTAVPIGGLVIPAGTTYAIYIKSDSQVNYTIGADTFSNDDLSLSLGVGVAGSWGAVFSPRTWNGTIHYYLLPGVLNNDSDPENDPLAAAWDSGPGNGALDLNLDGSFLYTPTVNFCGTDTFTYHADDGVEDSNITTVTLTINCVNDIAIANDDSYNAVEDTTLNISAPGVLTNDTDPDGDTLTAVVDTTTVSGTLILNSNGSFSYAPNPDYCGTDSFTYHAYDGQIASNTVAVTLDITCTNDPPVANDDTATTNEDTTVSISALSNDTDMNGDPLTITAVSTPSNGSVIHTSTTITYTPASNFNGTDVFTYTISDGNGEQDSATVTVMVNPINDNPVASDDSVLTDEDTAVTVDVLSNDTDVDGDILTIDSVIQGNHGVATVTGNQITYTPTLNLHGTDVFTYTISDGNGGQDTTLVTITIDPVNDDPVALDDSAATDEDTLVTIDVLANDTDVDGNILVIDSVTQGGHGTVVNNGVDVTYTPNSGFGGSDSFTYTISDGNGGSDTATVTVQVASSPGTTIFLPLLLNGSSSATIPKAGPSPEKQDEAYRTQPTTNQASRDLPMFLLMLNRGCLDVWGVKRQGWFAAATPSHKHQIATEHMNRRSNRMKI